MAKLIQKTTVLDYVGDDGEIVLLMGAVDDGTVPPPRLLITTDAYNDFGRPEQVSVAIRPGNCFEDADVAFQTPPGE